CNISNILSAKSVGEEVSAKSGLQRSGSEGVAAKSITDITDPTPAPPLEGRGWLRINPFCKGSTAISLPKQIETIGATKKLLARKPVAISLRGA
ncbi:MAG: hypothetical protein K6B13_12315, partial [Prevotella sp.]|nr:hypothetical protein [Prevotella sp.]